MGDLDTGPAGVLRIAGGRGDHTGTGGAPVCDGLSVRTPWGSGPARGLSALRLPPGRCTLVVALPASAGLRPISVAKGFRVLR